MKHNNMQRNVLCNYRIAVERMILPVFAFVCLSLSPVLASDSLDTWTWRNPLPTGDRFEDFHFADDMWVAVERAGRIFTSLDGSNWIQRSSGTSGRLTKVVYGDGKWVVVGRQGTILTSPDGISWTERSSGTLDPIADVAYGDGKWVAVGGERYGGTGVALVSSDGINWTETHLDTVEGLTRACPKNR